MPPLLGYLFLGLLAVGLALLGAVYWRSARRRIPASANGQGPHEIVSLVFLLRRPHALVLDNVKAAAERAFGRVFGGTDAEWGVIPTDRSECFIVKTPKVALGVISANGPYVENVGAAADHTRDFRCKRALQEHRAWLAVDQVGEPPLAGAATSYRFIGKLIAELANEDCLAVYCTQTRQMNSYASSLLPLLRGRDPLAALTAQHEDQVVAVDENDTEMRAAVAESRRRWPEFVSAFNRRRPLQGFAVKAPFRTAGSCEYMWVEISKLDPDNVHGKLVNEPKLLGNLKLNDDVIVAVKDVEDWLYSDGECMVGGFTAKVLENRH